MAEIGSLGALNYEMTFPSQQQQFAAQAPMGQPAPVEVPEYSSDPIAVREKLTSDYYNNMGQLRAFAKDMSAKGIDPFQPDYTQEGGGLAFQTMQKLQANLMYAANALGNEFKAETQMRPYLAQGATRLAPNTDTQGLYAQDPNNYIPTRQLPGTEALNQRLAQETNDPNSQARANAQIQPYIDRLDQMVEQGLIHPAKAQMEKDAIIENAWKTQPFSPRNPPGPTQQDLLGRGQIIKQIKQGIINGDQSSLNILKTATSVEDAGYVNTGDKIGIEVWFKGQPSPAFVDLSKGGGEAELNALFNRIEGQKNIPNEMLSGIDTKVEIPSSNVRQIIDGGEGQPGIKDKVKNLDEATISKLNSLAASRQLSTPNGEIVTSVEINTHWYKPDELRVKYHPIENNKINYNKVREMNISDADELDNFIETNANKIGPAFGGGFVTKQSTGLEEPQVVNPGGKKIW